MKKYNDIQWIVQRNLVSYEEYTDLIKTFQEMNVNWVSINFVPFENRIEPLAKIFEPDVNKLIIAMGSAAFINTVYKENKWKPGVFFNPDKFNYRNWGKEYQDLLLNSDYRITTIEELRKDFRDKDLFIRPIHDNKIFGGQVFNKNSFLHWTSPVMSYVKYDTEIVVSTPKHIEKEWRLVVVDEEIVSGSLYRKNHRLCTEADYWGNAARTAEKAISIYKPDDVFVIDIAKVGNEYKVIEVGCFNAAGFYQCHMNSVVKAVSEFVIERKGKI